MTLANGERNDGGRATSVSRKEAAVRENAFSGSRISDRAAAPLDGAPEATRRVKEGEAESFSQADLNLSFRFIRPCSPAIDFGSDSRLPGSSNPRALVSPTFHPHVDLLWSTDSAGCDFHPSFSAPAGTGTYKSRT